MHDYFKFLSSFNCTIWVFLTFLVCGILSIVTKLAEEQTGWRKVLLISVVAFCIGTFSAFRTKGTNADILYFIQSRDFTILVVISGLLTVILADLLGVLSKKGDGWKIGIVGIVALHFGVLAVFYPIF